MKAEDYRAIHAELPELYRLRDAAALPGVMLEAIRRLIPCLFCTYNHVSQRTGALVAAYHPADWQPRMEAIMPRMAPHIGSHPVYRNVYDNGDSSPHFVSDFASEEEWSITPFASALETIGVRDSLIFCLHTSHQDLIFIALNRGERSFSEDDREMAAYLRPHLTAAFENAAAFTEAQALALLSARAIEQSSQGVALVDRHGNILHINAPGSDLLRRFFPHGSSWKAILPDLLKTWLERQMAPTPAPAEPLLVETDGARLSIRSATLANDRFVILFQESDPRGNARRLQSLGLSSREAEVLLWVSEGKSNDEIGTILGISPRTVAKHLELIFRKIKVETRVAAALRAKEVCPG
ncbi:helix-turn-helix transcriptional regulator [Luteolibacter sp. SL250]|uniref:helix-turn-helix transcriptional regulator n=1 Tax=Luteolibacter sp. SL250 TaxID=2995170 RepID=UPI00227186EB|nr:helix-turn-helix transcriptional regulator [Luteolibacter sp. SL250]WAC21263.1 helix-turn-helix transcriptional regulator [Luteolibacter sp. SL250]